MAPHTPQRSERAGKPVALLDDQAPQTRKRPGGAVALLDPHLAALNFQR